MRLKFSLKKILTVIATLATLANSFAAPSVAIAQELSTPAPVDTSTPAPTVAPTENPTTTPDATPAETMTPTPEVTATPDLVTPAPTETPTVTQAPESNPTTTAPPADSNSSPTAQPSLSATPTASPEPQDNPSIASTVLTTNVFPQTIQDNSWFKLITDKLDYSPTEIVQISGSGFISNKDYTLEVVSTDAPPVDFTTQVKADGSGNINYSYQLDGNYRPNYTVYIKSGEVIIATVTFTDAKETSGNISVNFDQCANNDHPTPAGQCNWIGSILQKSNSSYFEGMSIPQRILYQGINTGGSHTLTFSYSYTKGGTHAYDFLTSLNQGNSSFSPGITNLDKCDGLSGGDATACNALISTSPSFATIPFDPFDSKDSAPGLGTGTTQTQKENWYEGAFGSRQFTIYSSVALTPGSITLSHDVSADGDTTDSNVNVSFSFSLPTSCTTTACSILIFFGGHLAVTGNNNTIGDDWGTPLGSSNINGGPYHIKSLKLDGSGGSLDNQIAGADIILPGTIIINKTAVGSNKTFNYTSTGGSTVPSNFDITTASGSGSITFNNVLAGTYSITEGSQSSPWAFTSLQCTDPTNSSTTNAQTANINVAAGETVTCGYTNTYTNPTGTLIVKKLVINDNGGTLTPKDFSFKVDGGTSIPFTEIDSTHGENDLTLNSGSYSVTEPTVSGYTTTYNNCSNVTVPSGGSATCTITNDDQPGTLIVKKLVINDNGGTSTPSDFSFQVGNGAAVPFTETDTTHGENHLTVDAGKYTVTEPAVSGYTTTYSNCTDVSVPNGGSATCTITNDDQQAYITITKVVHNDHGGNANPDDFKLTLDGDTVTSGVKVAVNPGPHTAAETQLPGYTFDGFSDACNGNGSVTVALGESKTCTLTNSDQQAYITVVKNVIKDNGGTANPDDFKLTLEGSPVLSGVAVPVRPGTYTATETLLPGYSFTGFSDNCDGNGDVTVALGESKTCTLTNDDIAPSLTLVKSVDNSNGGNNVATDWTLTASGPTTISGDGGTTSDSTFKSGTYTLSEVGKTGTGGYIAGDWSCTGNGIQRESSITLTNGQSATCTIINSALPAHITLNKVISGSQYGDTIGINGFGLIIGGTSVLSGQTLGVDANVNYALNEAGHSGYEFVSLTGDVLCPSVLGGTVKLSEGGSISCTITNKAVQPHLIVIKHVVNNSGGNKDASNFTVNVTGTNVSDTSFTGEESPGTNLTLDVGSYSVDEGAHDGYTKDLSTDCAGTIALGETKTCTITNDDVAPQLKLVKNVSGGTSIAHDWTLTATGTGGFNDYGNSITFHPVTANSSYALSESGPTGYSPSDWSCDNGQTGSSVSLDPGTNVTCTITNTRDTATLTINKTVIGEDNTFDFAVNGPSASTPEITTVGGAGTTGQITIYTGNYTVTEPAQPAGWQLTGNLCTINGGRPFNGGGRGFGVAKGDNVVCNFEDTELGNIIVKKVMVGGTASFDFTGNIDGTISTDGGKLSLNSVLPKNGFTSTESPKAGWELTSISCNDGESTNQSTWDVRTRTATFNVDPGETVTCTFTNTKYGYMQGRKYVDSNMDGRLENGESFLDNWTVRLYNSTWQPLGTYTIGTGGLLTGQYKFGNLLPGIYNTCEVQQTGYQQTGPLLGAHAVDYNGNQVNGSTAVANGSGQTDEAPICWQSTINGNGMEWLGFGNIQLGKIIVEKETNNETEDRFTFSSNYSKNFTLGNGGRNDSGYLLPGDYSVSERTSNNWQLGSATCDNEDSPSNIHLGPGDIVTCRFVNNELVPGVSITKSNDSGSGITAGATVTYTLNVKNTGSIDFNNVYVYDFLPGGFTYVDGSVAGATFISLVGSKLTLNLSSLAAGETATITYKVSTNSSLANGTYTNYATCQATYFEESILPCDPANSNVTIGNGIGYGGNMQGQVLGASTELPATGSPTELLLISLAILGLGIFLNGYTMRKQKKALKKASKKKATKKKSKRHAKK